MPLFLAWFIVKIWLKRNKNSKLEQNNVLMLNSMLVYKENLSSEICFIPHRKNSKLQISIFGITIQFLHFAERRLRLLPQYSLWLNSYIKEMHQSSQCNSYACVFSLYLSKMMSRLKLRLAYLSFLYLMTCWQCYTMGGLCFRCDSTVRMLQANIKSKQCKDK